MANRKRTERIKFRVTKKEKDTILRRMKLMKTDNLEAYMRKCAIDGVVVSLELPELTHAVSNLKVFSKRFNEIAKRVNATDRIYPEDINEMKAMFYQMLDDQNRLLKQVEKLN